MNLICNITFGSHLYGTATEKSDRDFKGVFLPKVEDILLGRIPRSQSTEWSDSTRRNKPGELDCEYYSLHYFLRLAMQGQTGAIDMLFAPDRYVVKSPEYGYIWDKIVANRHKLLSKNMHAFAGYARGQAAKYSLKGSRLAKLQDFSEVLGLASTATWKLSELWDKLPRDDERINAQGIRELQIAGKWFGETTDAMNVYNVVEKQLAAYGKRAHAASEANGVDWKALSHAVRVSKELIELLTFGQITFPLQDAKLILDIKQGNLTLEAVQDILDRDLAFAEFQMAQCKLPDGVDGKFWDDFVVGIMEEYLASNQTGANHA